MSPKEILCFSYLGSITKTYQSPANHSRHRQTHWNKNVIKQFIGVIIMGVGRGWQGGVLTPLDFEIWYFSVNVFVKKVFFLRFELLKWNFTTAAPTEITLLATPWKIILPTPMVRMTPQTFGRVPSVICYLICADPCPSLFFFHGQGMHWQVAGWDKLTYFILLKIALSKSFQWLEWLRKKLHMIPYSWCLLCSYADPLWKVQARASLSVVYLLVTASHMFCFLCLPSIG